MSWPRPRRHVQLAVDRAEVAIGGRGLMLFPGMIGDSLSFCHAELKEASRHLGAEMLRFAQHAISWSVAV